MERSGHAARNAAALTRASLVSAWVYSLLYVPLYLPGRYDTIVLPLFLVLFAVGIDRIWRWQRWAGSLIAIGAFALATMGSFSTLDPSAVPVSLDVHAGRTLARVAAPGDRVIATALRGQVTLYYAARSGFHGTIQTYPSEVNDHPGWESPDRMLTDPMRLQEDAEKLIGELVDTARRGHRIWILPTGRGPINDFFFPPLFSEMEPDPQFTFQDAGLVGLRLR